MSDEENELIPKIKMTFVPGIPGINSDKMSYMVWHLLNEALSCYVHKEYFACLVSLNACIEKYLQSELDIQLSLYRLINRAKEKQIITEKEAAMFHRIRETRNSYMHYVEDKLPLADRMRTVKYEDNMEGLSISEAIDIHGWGVDPHPTPDHKDYYRLGMLAPFTYSALNGIIKFFQRKYASDVLAVGAYIKYDLIEIEGADPTENVFFVRYLKEEKKKGFIEKIRDRFTLKRPRAS